MTLVRSMPVAATAPPRRRARHGSLACCGSAELLGRVSRDLDGRRPGSGPARKGGGVAMAGTFAVEMGQRRACVHRNKAAPAP